MLEIIRDYKKVIIAFLLVVLIGLGFFFFNRNDTKEEVTTIENKVAVKEEKKQEEVKEIVVEPKYINVDIKGAVKKAGVYQVLDGTIINDVLKMAGLKRNSTTKNINLSKRVVDEMVINVLTTSQLKNRNNNVADTCACDKVDITECIESSVIIPNDEEVAVSAPTSNKISINKATKEDLMKLSGIGEARALAIIEYRNNNGGFKSLEELMNISGIGESLYNKIKEDITL